MTSGKRKLGPVSEDIKLRRQQPGCLRRIWALKISFFVCSPELG